MPDNTIEIDPGIGTHDVNGWRAVPHPTNPTGRRNGAWCVVAGDYADEGEPDVLIEVTAAEHPKDVAEFIVQAVINEYARRTASEPCARCEGSRIEPGSAEYAEHSHLPINGQRCSACDGTGLAPETPGDAETDIVMKEIVTTSGPAVSARGATKSNGSTQILKKHGWYWLPPIRAYVAKDDKQIAAAVKALRDAGLTVHTPRRHRGGDR